MEQFNDYLDGIDLEILRRHCREEGGLCRFAKGEHFVRQGAICCSLGLVVKGYFKFTTLNSNAEESVINFAFENEFVTDFNGSYHGLPSEVSIIAGTECEIYTIPIEVMRKYLSANNREMSLSLYKSLFHMVYRRYLSLHSQSPKERYISLIDRFPAILNTVTLKDLASYLLITPSHLSRLRKEVVSGK